MKRKLFYCTLFCALVILCSAVLTSCFMRMGSPRSADELWEKVSGKMDAVSSYEERFTMDITYYYGGYEIKAKVNGESVVIYEQPDDMYYLMESSTEIVSEEMSYKESYTSRDAYIDGKYYIFRESSDHTQKIFSAMTREQVDELHFGDEDESVEYGDAREKSFVKNGDGGWTITFRAYPTDKLELLMEFVGVDTDMFSQRVTDAVVRMNVSDEYLVSLVDIEFTFEQSIDSDETSVAKVEIEYSNIDSAERRADTVVNASEYTEVDDIKILVDIEDMLDRINETKDGKFTLTIDQTVDIGGDVGSMTEKDIVEYGENENGFFYDIDTYITMDSDKYTYDVHYSDGKQTSEMDGESISEDMSDEDAQYFLSTLINSMDYDSMYVSDVEMISDNEYKLICEKAEPSRSSAFFEGIGGKLGSATQTMTFTVKDGMISEVVSELDAKGNVTSGGFTYIASVKLSIHIVYNRVTEN